MGGGGDPLYALPNVDELKQLNVMDSGSVIRSNLLKMQLDRVLENTKLKYDKHQLKNHLHTINSITQSIENQMVSEDCLQLKGLSLKQHNKRIGKPELCQGHNTLQKLWVDHGFVGSGHHCTNPVVVATIIVVVVVELLNVGKHGANISR